MVLPLPLTTELLCLMLLNFANMAVSIRADSMDALCLGQPQTFLCEVQKQGSLIFRLQWRVGFVSSPPVPRITRRFTADDPEGLILKDSRSGINFEFNLTSNSNLSSLTSVMTVTVEDINGTSFNNATLECEGDEAYPITLQVNKGPLPVHTYFTHDQDNVTILWSPNDNDRIDYYIISVTTNTIEASFTTSNASIQLPLQYNQEYNISVIANNCAGNSTPTEMSMKVGYCTFSTAGISKIISIEGNTSGEEKSRMSFYCRGSESQPIMEATCMTTGEWSPDPSTYNFTMCHHDQNNTKVVPKNLPPHAMEIWHVVATLIAMVVSFLIVLITLSIIIMTLKVYRRKFKTLKRVIVDDCNHYSDLPISNANSENQELGIYSLLQPEEQTATRLQSTDRTASLIIYADVGSALTRNPNTNANVSLQLDDDRVQYAALNHHQQTSELDQRESNSHAVQSSDELPPPVPLKIADLDEEMMSSDPSTATKAQPK